ncbi:unnamed protein product [Gongylonema pulchrum]|uniref:RRM domain-containing protein n=1 Tax=Gongylonema pulchrum TaxID=637853 RepID=A0A183EWM1_9BILA|nr:unnamed protein product [Gongylonema pulchrum]
MLAVDTGNLRNFGQRDPGLFVFGHHLGPFHWVRSKLGFGYLEFSNAQSAAEAIAGMNMFDLGGQFLRVGKCITPPDALTYIVPTSTVNLPTAAAVAAAEVTAKIQAEEMTAKKSPITSIVTGKSSPSVSPSSILFNNFNGKTVLEKTAASRGTYIDCGNINRVRKIGKKLDVERAK